MKVVCIDNTIGNSRLFKLNSVYESIDYTFVERVKLRLPDNYIVVIKDNHDHDSDFPTLSSLMNHIWCDVSCFISLEDFRETKLDELGI